MGSMTSAINNQDKTATVMATVMAGMTAAKTTTVAATTTTAALMPATTVVVTASATTTTTAATTTVVMMLGMTLGMTAASTGMMPVTTTAGMTTIEVTGTLAASMASATVTTMATTTLGMMTGTMAASRGVLVKPTIEGGDKVKGEEVNVLWDVTLVIPTDKEKVECRNTGCIRQVVATWASNIDPEDKWDYCENCQLKEMGGWPDRVDPMKQSTTSNNNDDSDSNGEQEVVSQRTASLFIKGQMLQSKLRVCYATTKTEVGLNKQYPSTNNTNIGILLPKSY